MKKAWLSILLALLLALGGAALAEETEAVDEAVGEVGEVDLFAPEVYAGERPELPPDEAPVGPADAAEAAFDAAWTDGENATVIRIDTVHFPDAAFRLIVQDEIDRNGDGWLTEAERMSVDEIYAPGKGIVSLQGIGYFSRLETIYCGRNAIREIDLSGNDRLVNLNLNDNQLIEIDLSGNPRLELLDVSGNLLDELDLRHSAKLKTMYAEGNDIVRIDIGQCPTLLSWLNKEKVIEDGVVNWGATEPVYGYTARLSVNIGTRLTAGAKVLYAPPVVAVDAEHFPAEDFREYVAAHCDADGDGWLDGSEIDAVKTITLRSAEDYFHGVGELDCPTLEGIEYFIALERLICPGCGVEALALDENEALNTLECFGNALTELDLSANAELERLWCYGNRLERLDLIGNPKLESLSCFGNQLTALNVTKCPALEALYCNGNRLTALNVTKCPALEDLDCSDNDIRKLDVRRCPMLKTLSCEGNALTALNVTANAKLTALRCADNAIKSLNVKKNTALRLLYCGNNALTALTLSANRALEQLDCADNGIRKLDLSKNTKLTELWCQGNHLDKVDVGKCQKLVRLASLVRRRTDGDTVFWQKTAGKYAMGVSRLTTLTAGKKVLYRGR